MSGTSVDGPATDDGPAAGISPGTSQGTPTGGTLAGIPAGPVGREQQKASNQ
ncbi:MAG: hypothetical protein LBL86_04855 [Coriobacteriales bacterium]|jgi:hypothetical protein|nr:hypothetical protein [Coriobacteriales bacterium]